jgi:hypothetical protein
MELYKVEGKHMFTIHRAMWTEGLHTIGCSLVPKGIIYDTAVATLVPCSL